MTYLFSIVAFIGFLLWVPATLAISLVGVKGCRDGVVEFSLLGCILILIGAIGLGVCAN